MSRLIGCARVSTDGQTLDSQVEALEPRAILSRQDAVGFNPDRQGSI
jgi:hypothetical protein